MIYSLTGKLSQAFRDYTGYNHQTPPVALSNGWTAIIYEGTMPADWAEFETDFATKYKYIADWANKTAPSQVGTNVLGAYAQGGTSLSNNTVYSSTQPLYHTQYVKDGTATFAMLVGKNTSSNGAFFNNASIRINDSQIIIPITDLAGNGVIKLESTTVSGSMPSFSGWSLTLGVS